MLRGSWSWGDQKLHILCHCLGVHIWLSLVGPKMEARTNIREAVNC